MQKDVSGLDFSVRAAKGRDEKQLGRLQVTLHRMPAFVEELSSAAVSGLGVDDETATFIVQDLIGRCASEASGMWEMACGRWHVADGMWRVACGAWFVACTHACGTWQVACAATSDALN